eukprot:3658189-Karenia_brevis.AAC.1
MDTRRVKLDEKYFKRIDKSEGDHKMLRSWMFNLKVAVGQVDKELADEIMRLISRDDEDPEVDKVVYDKYSNESYGVLASLTSGEPVCIIEGLGDTKLAMDGLKAV